jgi:hypothetical protein
VRLAPKPHGNKNQPDKPNLVISSNAALNQCGSPLAHSTALASKSGMEIAAAATSARVITMIPEDCGSLVDRADRISAREQSATFSEMLCAMRCNGDRWDTPSPTGLVSTRPKPAFGAFTACSQFQTPRSRPACRC